MKELDLQRIPLKGMHLVEASAGTGKTYAIGSLYLRLLLEKSLGVDRILVVTYTVAATEELNTRIRDNIRRALDAFRTGRSEDAFMAGLLERCPDHDRAGLILDHALMLFDEAAIFTIHGFCQRVLTEMAFESSNLFDAELITDQQDMMLEVVDDFYRRELTADQPPELVCYARHKGISPEKLMNLVSRASLDAEIIPHMEQPDITAQLNAYRHAFERAKTTWDAMREEITEILLDHPGLNRNRYRQSSVRTWIEFLEEYMESGGQDLPLFGDFKRFTFSGIMEGTKNRGDTPGHAFFEESEELKKEANELVSCMDEYLIWLEGELFGYVRTHLAEKKDRMGVISFNDLLLKVRSALDSSMGPYLISALRDRYGAALVDEFQDTDPIQYGIFSAIFDGLPLFLIGDPKQAIYSFRGADIFTYLNAARHVPEENRHTLKKNWRSEESLIEAVNRMFSRPGNDNPFVFRQIGFEPVEPADKKDRAVLKDSRGSSLTLWFLCSDDGKPLNKELSVQQSARAVALEISRLLDCYRPEAALLGDRPIRPDDIAVLVRENRQALLVRDELAGYGIPCVVYSDENVFKSEEAFELEVLLKGISQSHSEGLVKAALTTSCIGMNSQEIETLIKDEPAWEKCLMRFRHYHELWAARGFMRMFRELLSTEQVRQRVLAARRGERTLTNYLHLAELLNRACTEKRLGMTELLKWLSLQRETSLSRADEYQLRLESDEHAVKILTVHKSKGLEYPIVFCPFNWGDSKLRDNGHFPFHDPETGWKAFFELGSARIEENRMHAEKEVLAENMRLLYVALTRAKNRCYVVWGTISNTSSSSLAYLLHHQGLSSDSNGIEPLEQGELNVQTMKQDLDSLVMGPQSPIAVLEIPRGVPALYTPPGAERGGPAHREFSGRIDRSWRVSSFSALVGDAAHTSEAPDYDALYLRPAREEDASDGSRRDIFTFPRGARPGTMMHKLFEKLDFLSDDAAIDELAAETLAAYGYDPSWKGVITGMVRKVLAVKIHDFHLGQVCKDHRRCELEFYFPLNQLSPEDLAGCFFSAGAEDIPEDFGAVMEDVDFDPVHGFMRGFIDMVFLANGRYYLIDWKSNHLGDRAGDYNTAALERAMRDNYYVLQYHIYTLAVHRYLKNRVKGYSYDEHFGGVIYVFLRGVDPGLGEEYGIYCARPSEDFIERLSRTLVARDQGM